MRLLAVITIFLPFSVMALPPLHVPTEWEIKADGSGIKTSENYDNSGSVYTLPSSGDFTNVNSKLYLEYQVQKNWHLSGGADLGYSQSNSGSIHRNNTAFNALRVGTDFNFNYRKFEFIPVAELTLSLTKVDSTTDDVLLNDGAHSFTAGIWAKTKWGRLLPYGYLGLTYKTSDLASPYDMIFGTSLPISQIQFYAEIHNSSIWKNDAYLSQPTARWSVSNLVDAGSYYFYSINPTFTDLSLGTSVDWGSDLITNFGLSYSLTGYRYIHGLSFTFSVIWGFGYTPEEQSMPKAKTKPTSKPTKFKEKVEDEDQTLFEE